MSWEHLAFSHLYTAREVEKGRMEQALAHRNHGESLMCSTDAPRKKKKLALTMCPLPLVTLMSTSVSKPPVVTKIERRINVIKIILSENPDLLLNLH